ncbi:hypothetical protein BV20DRAFT_972985 [Pilatotrama ljubarskyi]|nr:hypothetical protein BV20DRAFT_972985 [Pilatotrama ljubarskyi]
MLRCGGSVLAILAVSGKRQRTRRWTRMTRDQKGSLAGRGRPNSALLSVCQGQGMLAAARSSTTRRTAHHHVSMVSVMREQTRRCDSPSTRSPAGSRYQTESAGESTNAAAPYPAPPPPPPTLSQHVPVDEMSNLQLIVIHGTQTTSTTCWDAQRHCHR